MNKLFVYGILRDEGTRAKLNGVAVDESGGFNTLVPGDRAIGQLIEVDDARLREMDSIEGEGVLYHRINVNDEVQCYVGDGRKLSTDSPWTFDRTEIQSYFDKEVTLNA